jgi:hypothetical protein
MRHSFKSATLRAGMFTASILLANLTACGNPNIESECVMNGFGKGECSFTNTGDAPGAQCGRIYVQRLYTSTSDPKRPDLASSTFCSGEVAPSSTARVEFTIPDVSTHCEPKHPTAKWSSMCSFEFTLNE